METNLGHASWSAIAALVAAVHFALGEPKAVKTDEESLKSAVDTFQTQSPAIYADIKKWAEMAAGSRSRSAAERDRGPIES